MLCKIIHDGKEIKLVELDDRPRRGDRFSLAAFDVVYEVIEEPNRFIEIAHWPGRTRMALEVPVRGLGVTDEPRSLPPSQDRPVTWLAGQPEGESKAGYNPPAMTAKPPAPVITTSPPAIAPTVPIPPPPETVPVRDGKKKGKKGRRV